MKRLLLLSLTLALFAVPSWAQGDYRELARIDSVGVYIKPLAGNARQFLDTLQLKTQVELGLRSYGLRVYPRWDERGSPRYYVKLEVAYVGDATAETKAYLVILSLRGPAIVQRTGESVVLDIWNRSVVGVATAADITDRTRQALQSLTDMLVNDWLQANPKP